MTDREHIEQLEEEVRQLRALLMPVFVPPPEWNLTKAEVDLLRLLATRPFVTPDIAATAIEIDRPTLGVLIYRLRKKVAEVEIKNDRGRGYYVEPWHKELILQKSSNWIKAHEIEIGDHVNMLRVFDLVVQVDTDRLEKLVRLVHYVKRILGPGGDE